MAIATGNAPLSPDEILYRRIAKNTGWYDPERHDPKRGTRPSMDAFLPNKGDVDGLSLTRALCKSPEEAAEGREGNWYYVAQLRVGDLLELGLKPEVDKPDRDPSHVLVRQMSYAALKDKEQKIAVKAAANKMADNLCLDEVFGPYYTPMGPTSC